MGLISLLFRAIVVGLIAWLAGKVLSAVLPRQERTSPRHPPREGATPGTPRVASGRLVRDPWCQVALPEERAIQDGDFFYCSMECRDRHRAARSASA